MSIQGRDDLWEVRKSVIHGTGGFALGDIEQGTYLVHYKGELISKAESAARAEKWEADARARGDGLVYTFEIDDEWDIDGNIPNNPAKYINHHCNANCEAVNVDGEIWIAAARDIEQDEELSFDYGYGIDSYRDHPCRCGAENCIGYIVNKDQRWRLRHLIARGVA